MNARRAQLTEKFERVGSHPPWWKLYPSRRHDKNVCRFFGAPVCRVSRLSPRSFCMSMCPPQPLRRPLSPLKPDRCETAAYTVSKPCRPGPAGCGSQTLDRASLPSLDIALRTTLLCHLKPYGTPTHPWKDTLTHTHMKVSLTSERPIPLCSEGPRKLTGPRRVLLFPRNT